MTDSGLALYDRLVADAALRFLTDEGLEHQRRFAACEIDAEDRGFTPIPEDLAACDRLRQLGILKLTFVDGEMCFDLTPAARTADRLRRLTETAQASMN
jgi:hypothetical protein